MTLLWRTFAAKNGRDKAWKIKYLGVGNESWGCGGSMRPEYYADLYRRYSTYCRNYDGNRLFKIASGASDYDYNWTDVLMNRVGHRMQGLSLHYYTVTGWSGSKTSATQFNKDDYYWTMGKCLEVEEVLKRHCAIMDKYDKDKKNRPFTRRMGNLVGRRTRNHQRTPLSAKHIARRFRCLFEP